MHKDIALTKKQEAVWRYICAYKLEYGRPPTQPQIGEHFGHGKCTSSWYIYQLERRGYIQKDRSRHGGAYKIIVWPRDWQELVKDRG